MINNNSGYHQANSSISGWSKLSTEMKGRYFRWKMLADTSWSGKYVVIVSFKGGRNSLGRQKVQTNNYLFDTEVDANECKQWWTEYNPLCSVNILGHDS